MSDYFTPNFIATDNKSELIINHAKERSINIFKGNPRNGKLITFLNGNLPDILLSVNYIFLLDQELLDQIKYPINLHGSLLPKYRGRTPHVWAIINNEQKTGVTAHIIDKGCDTGPIILQDEIEIDFEDTGTDLLKKYASVYPRIIKETINRIIKNEIYPIHQDESKATFFTKRTPSDGEINWEWHRERIRNWVRAQAYPYPGAFTFLKRNKIVIDEISFSDHGFNQTDPNGLVLETIPEIIVKTPNGAIKLDVIRNNKGLIKKGTILGI